MIRNPGIEVGLWIKEDLAPSAYTFADNSERTSGSEQTLGLLMVATNKEAWGTMRAKDVSGPGNYMILDFAVAWHRQH